MKQLEELVHKVNKLIEKNGQLEQKIHALEEKNRLLVDHNNQLEGSLLNQSSHLNVLTDEKDTIKSNIEELLKTINSLDSVK